MKIAKPAPIRKSPELKLKADLVVIGGGMAGTCCAITAARRGIDVILVQDRPVLGGNASSEVRLWILGATSHMGNNNRWAREGGVLDEILVENMFRNPEGNTLILDTILLEKVVVEPKIKLLLNTAVYGVKKTEKNRIQSVHAFSSQNSTYYLLEAPLFCDASGDGIVGFQSGAAFRMGAESAEAFNEPFAPSEEYGELLGHSMYFMSKDVGKPVKFVAPTYALKDITKIPHYRRFNVAEHGCWLWWIEYGGRLDTIHDTEEIKWELWKVVYGVWDYIKNSGNFPEAENLTLEWVGQIPGKRESRRFEGPYMLKQSDIVEQKPFYDVVAHGGWAIDLHPADGVFSEKPSCNQWHSKGIYAIPYRCMISRNIENLFLAGRIISASHVAFGSTRVMATCAHAGQAVGMAAALAIKNHWQPSDLVQEEKISTLQQELLRSGQYIPHLSLKKNQLEKAAHCTASSTLKLSEIPFDGSWFFLDHSAAQLLPLQAGPAPQFEVEVRIKEQTKFKVSLRTAKKPYNYTPEVVVSEQTISLSPGEQRLKLNFAVTIEEPTYYFLCFHKNEKIAIRRSKSYITGITSLYNKQNPAVSNYGRQDPDPSLGFEAFEFWVPTRRPESQNIAMQISPPLDAFAVKNIFNGFFRPYLAPNAWIADLSDPKPEIIISWTAPVSISELILSFDTDWDHAMESSLLGHDERIMPFVVRNYEIFDDRQNTVFKQLQNHQTRNHIKFEPPVISRQLTIKLEAPSDHVPAALFGVMIR